MMQEIQGIQNQYEGRNEEHLRTVAQVFGSEAQEVLRGQKKPYKNIKYFSKWEREQIVRETQDALGAAVTHGKISKKKLHEREVQQQRITPNLEYQEAQPRGPVTN